MSLPVSSISNQPSNSNRKPILIGLTVFLLLSIVSLFIWKAFNNREIRSPVSEEISAKNETEKKTTEGQEKVKTEVTRLESAAQEKAELAKPKNPGDINDKTRNFNILVLGIDRRYGGQTSWRTDVIQLVTISKDRKKVLITHIPRDVWAGSYKINALYNLQGPSAIKDKVEEITGQRPDRIIRFDFDAFVWAVDAVGGVTIDVPRAFVDEKYPDDRSGNNETKTVKFEKGEQTMDGETALIYARSRKGNNGEGSDYARGTRQQLIMQAIVKDFFTKKTIFNPKTPEVLYKLATEKVYTDFTLTDTKILFELAKNYKSVVVSDLSLDTTNYLVVPSDRSEYGGAWTLIAKDGTFAPIHNAINNLIQ